jgi:hypothetical protein
MTGTVPSINLYSMLSDIGESFSDRAKKDRDTGLLSDIGSTVGDGDYGGAARKAFSAGRLSDGIKLLELEQDRQKARRQEDADRQVYESLGIGGGGASLGGGAGPYNVPKAYALLKSVGANDDEARTLAAIAQVESKGNPRAFNPRGRDLSYGLWQINMLGGMGPERRAKFGIQSNDALFDPETNARVALKLARDRGGYQDWTTYTSGKHRPYLQGGGGRSGFSEIKGGVADLPGDIAGKLQELGQHGGNGMLVGPDDIGSRFRNERPPGYESVPRDTGITASPDDPRFRDERPAGFPSTQGNLGILAGPEDIGGRFQAPPPLPPRRPSNAELYGEAQAPPPRPAGLDEGRSVTAPRVIQAPAYVPRRPMPASSGDRQAPPGTHWAQGPGEPLLLRDDMDAATIFGGSRPSSLSDIAPRQAVGTVPAVMPRDVPIPPRRPTEFGGVPVPGPDPRQTSDAAPAMQPPRTQVAAGNGFVPQTPQADRPAPQAQGSRDLEARWDQLNRMAATPGISDNARRAINAEQEKVKFLYQQREAQRVRDDALEERRYAQRQAQADREAAREANDPGKKLEAEIAARARIVQSQGGDLNDPKTRQYINTGRYPREDAQPLTATDKKAILEADEMVSANQAAIDALHQAKTVSPRALGYPGAGWVSAAGALVGNEASVATQDLDNIVTSQALANLKSIFGAAPTEGERKILLDIQGSVSKPDEVRQKIYDRAIAMAERRLEFNRQRATELRGGDFYKPHSGAGQGRGNPQSQQQGAPVARPSQETVLRDARSAIARGASRDAVISEMERLGLDPSGL